MASRVSYIATATKRARRQRIRKLTRELFGHLLLLPLSIVYMIPFFWMLSTALKTDQQVMAWPPVWIPHPIAWDNFPKAIQFFPFWLFLKNTLIIAVFGVIGIVISSSLVAYSLARIHWPGRDILFGITVATMMLPYHVTMIPLFIVFKNLGWINTFLPLIVPAWFGGAFYIFLLRQFFMTIPQELSDAARIDGASELRSYLQIVLPLAKPALATVALFEFLGRWRDFLGPLIYLQDQKKYTISLGLSYFRLEHGTEWQLLMAASLTLTIPIIILFFFTQRTFIQGITLTGIKG
ncbi:MAG: carbohydrate ABC transporter permease [Anaerolineae bacterium]|nr:carbohydrate ABC transporter permease [Anaerolineae bacterium]